MTLGPSRAIAALPPSYPLPSLGAAFTRLYFLERHIRAADRMLARRWSRAIDEMRVRLEHEFDALWDAVQWLTEDLPALGRCRCRCGKVGHPTPEGAERQARALLIVNATPEKIDLKRLRIYPCPQGTATTYHVGHSRGGGAWRLRL